MTEKELISLGYEPKLCKIGTLYFHEISPFFCKFKNENTVLLFSSSDDMNPLGEFTTFEEMDELEKNYYMDMLTTLKREVSLLEAFIDCKWNKEKYIIE